MQRVAISNLIEIDLAVVAHRDNACFLWISVSHIMPVVPMPYTNMPPLLRWWHIHEQRFRILNAGLQV
jgi:hypothetical protein